MRSEFIVMGKGTNQLRFLLGKYFCNCIGCKRIYYYWNDKPNAKGSDDVIQGFKF